MALIVLILISFALYFKLFIFGQVPFPGDLLVGSYSPWFDYYKIPVQNPLISDVFSQFFLWKHLAVNIFKSGEWPLWNPYSFTGTPLLATYHSATLYPLNILLLLPKYWAWGLFIFSQTLIAAISMYLLLSFWVWSNLARLTGAMIFALGGLMTTWLELGTAVHAIAWLPLSLYFIECYLSKFQFRYLLLLIASLTFLILAGHVQILTFSFTVLFVFIFIRSWDKNLKKFSTYFFPTVACLGLSLLLCSLQLLPSLDLLSKSIRLTESYIGEFNFGLLPLKDFLKFFVADFFGNPVTRNYWGFLNYSETSSFIGSLTLPLLLFSYIYLKRNKIIIFFLILLPISLLLIFDNYISYTIYSLKIPFLTSSYASRMLFITTFSAAILSAFTIDQIIKEKQIEKLFKLAIWSWASFVGILIGSVLVHLIIQNIIESVTGKTHLRFYLDLYLSDKDYALSNFIISMRNSILPILLVSAFLIFFILIRYIQIKFIQRYYITLLCLGLFILITFDLGRYFLKFNPFVPQKIIFPEVPALNFLQKQPGVFRIGREHAEVLPPNTWMGYKLQSLEGYDPLYLNRYGKFIHYLNGGDIRTGNSARYAELSSKYDSPFIDAANVKYFIGIGRDRNGYIPGNLLNYHFNEAGYNKLFNDKSAVILENPKALPRVYFASSFKVVDESNLENIIMTDSSFDPRITALLEKDLKIATTSGKGKVSILSYNPNIVKIKTETENPEILILADQFDEGWKAKVDGKEVTISPANYIFRAIKVPAGEHEVIFSYYPKSFDIGLKISLITFFSISLYSFVLVKLKKF